MNTSRIRRWDIFCRVVDNFGDIGVSWRLARQLAAEHGIGVRLWVDQLTSLAALCPQVDAAAPRQEVQGVEVFSWHGDGQFPLPAEVVVEAFGCGLPARYVDAMARRDAPPLWIVLEYLSAESWVREHHGLPSPHPQLNLLRFFFFPGFTEGTGGVLREADLLARRDAFDAAARREWWLRQGFAPPPPGALTISLFAYAHAPVAALIEAWADSVQPVVLALPQTPLAAQVREQLHCAQATSARLRNLELRFLPFVPQPEYDLLLWACDVNFVRGEDSFARAQWAGKPFVWHIYPQAARAHEVKLDAFVGAFSRHLGAPAAQALRGLWHAWNGVDHAPPLVTAWQSFCGERAAITAGLRTWQSQLLALGDLGGNLVKFCTDQV